MTWYMGFTASAPPVDVGLDVQGRARFMVGVVARKRPSAEPTKELATILEWLGVGQRSVDIFATSMAELPEGDGPFMTIREAGGVASDGTHNDGQGAYERPSYTLTVTGESPAAARAMAFAAWRGLARFTNREVTA